MHGNIDSNWGAMEAAWMLVSKAQRDVPAHVAQEYCRPDRPFYPCPHLNEPTLPHVLVFYNWITSRYDSWFPLTSSNSGLGFDFGLIRSCGAGAGQTARRRLNLAAITRLDEVRTADLMQSREHLNPPTISHGTTM